MKKYCPKDYNIEEIRRNNITYEVQDWYDLISQLGIKTPVDSMLYAIELQYRNHNRYGGYGARKLPNLKGNEYAGMSYYFLLDPFRYDRGEESKQAAEEMLTYLILKSIQVDTVLKWQKQN